MFQFTKDNTSVLTQLLQKLEQQQVLLGIPIDSDNNERSDSNLTNAQIGFIQEYGSPINNLPARPFLIPGIENNTREFSKAIQNDLPGLLELNKGTQDVNSLFDNLGTVAVEAVQSEIQSQRLVKSGQLLNSITFITENI